jgi:hypothetical protein
VPADDQVTPLTAIGESAVHGPAAFTTTRISEQTPLALLGRTKQYHTCGCAHGLYHAPLATDNLSQSDGGIR